MRNAFVVCFVFILLGFKCFSQAVGVPVLIKGKVIDEFTNKPVEVTMVIKDKDDKKIKIQPNTISGEYSQVVKSGETYEVTFLNYDVVKESKTITVEFADAYKEFEFDFNIKKMQNNLQIYEINCFKENTVTLNDECTKLIKDFIDVYKFNRGAKFKLVLNTSNAEEADEVTQKLQELKKACSAWTQYKDRFVIESDEKDSDKDLLIIVTEIKDPLK